MERERSDNYHLLIGIFVTNLSLCMCQSSLNNTKSLTINNYVKKCPVEFCFLHSQTTTNKNNQFTMNFVLLQSKKKKKKWMQIDSPMHTGCFFLTFSPRCVQVRLGHVMTTHCSQFQVTNKFKYTPKSARQDYLFMSTTK